MSVSPEMQVVRNLTKAINSCMDNIAMAQMRMFDPTDPANLRKITDYRLSEANRLVSIAQDYLEAMNAYADTIPAK